ncbi:MAG: PAS domain S-box protein [Thermoplasmata archaeon]|nr:PAS domain S-box protein [Thermoplasmata archaeon]
MKNNHEIVQELKEEEKQGRLFSTTKESSKNSTSAHPAQNNTSNQNLDHKCFKNFFENAPIYEYMVSPEGTILEINKTALTNLGYKKEELIGKHLTAIYAPESHEKMKTLLSKWKETGEIDNEEMVIATKQGEKRIVLLSASSVRGADGAILYSTSVQKDVTEINKIYDELNKNLWLQNVKLQKLNETKKTFLKTTSHELRTPITSIKGYVQMLMKKTLGEINEEQRKGLEVILRNTNRLDQVIQNILDASSLESGIMKFIPRKVNPRMLVEEITKTMEPFANKKEMTINVNLEKDLPDLMIDGERIKQVLMNLVDNAIKFSPDGSMIHIKARKEKEDVLFEVQDFGQGIPKDKQGMIFESFYQADSGDDRKFGGAGLSLALSKGIVGLHGGNIWFESTEGTGSTFLFTLPIQSICGRENTDLNDEMSLENMPEKSASLAGDSVTTNTMDEEVSGSITEYEKSTTTPKENEERYEALFNSSFELIYLHDLKGNFIDANPTALKLLGYKKEELASLNFSSLLDSGQRWKAMKALNEIKKNGRQKEPTEYRLKTKNGTFIDVETTAEIVYRDGKPYAFQGIARNITEQKQAKQILKESEDKYKRLFDSSPDLICETDEKGNVLVANSNMTKSMGVPAEKLIGKNVFDIFPGEIAEERAKIARKALEEMKNQASEDERAGQYFQNIYVPIINPNGKRTVQLIARDVTVQKTAENALQKNLTLYRGLIDTTDTGFVILDQEGKVLDANQEYVRLSGHENLSQIRGRRVAEWTADYEKEKNAEAVGKCFREGQIRNLEIDYANAQGKITPIEINATVVKVDGAPQILMLCRDITERKKAEEALQKSENRYRASIELTQLLTWTTSGNGEVVEDILTWRKFTGQSYEEVKGVGWAKVIHPDDLERTIQLWTKAVETKSTYETEYRLRRSDGVYRNFLTCGRPILKEDGGIKEWVGICIDLTDRKRVEEKIKESEAQLSNAVKIAHLGPWEYDAVNDIFTFTDSFYAIFRTTAEQVGGYTMSSADYAKRFVHPEDVSVVVLEVRKAIETDDPNFNRQLEHRIIYSNGEVGYISVRFFIVKDEKGRTVRTYGVNQDITERKKAEEALKESEEKYRNVVERASDGIVIVRDMIIKYVNPRAFNILGYDPTELIDTLMTNYVHPDELPKVVEYYKRRIADEDTPRAYESVLVHKDGRGIDVEISGRAITYQGKPADMIMVHDIVKRKKAEKELKEKIDELERFKKLTVDRELKMIELKKRIKELEENKGTGGRNENI